MWLTHHLQENEGPVKTDRYASAEVHSLYFLEYLHSPVEHELFLP